MAFDPDYSTLSTSVQYGQNTVVIIPGQVSTKPGGKIFVTIRHINNGGREEDVDLNDLTMDDKERRRIRRDFTAPPKIKGKMKKSTMKRRIRA